MTAAIVFEEAAVSYAARGWKVFPCEPRGKKPRTAHGCHDATLDEAQIRAWWRQWPGSNVAIVTGSVSGIFVLDADGDEGLASLRKLQEAHGLLLFTVMAETARGVHYYYRLPPDV